MFPPLIKPYIYYYYWFSFKLISIDSNETKVKWGSTAKFKKKNDVSNHDMKKKQDIMIRKKLNFTIAA